jgi:trehalose utilization protein
MHVAIAEGITDELGAAVSARTATLDEPAHGLTDEVLSSTDVLFWWGHIGHDRVDDQIAAAVQEAVLDGMGLVVLHSAHLSKPFRLLMGTRCNLRWRESTDREVVWTVSPHHPVASGLPKAFVIPEHEMYSEYFEIPEPDELVFISSFTGGEVFRSGCCFVRGHGRIFYFSPGHETYPIYHQPEIRRVLANAALWTRRREPTDVDASATLNAPEGWYKNQLPPQ